MPIDARPPIPTESERIEERLTRKFEKDIRRGKIIEVLEELHEGKGMEGEIELTPDVAEALAAQVEVEHAKHVQPTPEEVKKVEAEEPVKEETPKKKGWFS